MPRCQESFQVKFSENEDIVLNITSTITIVVMMKDIIATEKFGNDACCYSDSNRCHHTSSGTENYLLVAFSKLALHVKAMFFEGFLHPCLSVSDP